MRGKRQEARGGTGACRRAVITRLLSFWREVEDDWQMGLVGCYSARPAWWAAQYVGPGNSFLYLFLFSIFLQLFGFIKNAKALCKMLQ